MRLAAVTTFLAATALGQMAPTESELQSLFKTYYEDRLRENPEVATMLGRSEYNDRWRDWSEEAIGRRRAADRRYLATLKALPLANLNEQNKISVRLMIYDLERSIETERLDAQLLRVSQLFGIHNAIFINLELMPARTVQDFENILARLRAIPLYVDQSIALLDKALAGGLTQPKVVIDRVVEQMNKQLSTTADNTALLAAFRTMPAAFPAEEQARLHKDAIAVYNEKFLPAWRKLHTYMTGTYAPKARATAGIGGLEGGGDHYERLVRARTTTTMTPAQIHELGKREVERIESAMLAIARESGFSVSLSQYQQKLHDSPEQQFKHKDEMLAYCRNAAKVIEPELPRLFRNIPQLLYGIRAIPDDREASTASNAQIAAPDGSRPGWFNLNTYQPDKQFKFDKEALVLHQAVPGHIFQGAVQQQLTSLPEIRRLYRNTAYGEGWALYAESLGAELGVYKDLSSRFGRLDSERFRAVRLVVDTGLHALGWNRAQAVDYFQTHAPSESLSEIDRYISWPGQALGYKIGQLKFLELRAMAERELGSKFDVREFHDVVLRNGTLPLEILEEQVKAYIESAKPRG